MRGRFVTGKSGDLCRFRHVREEFDAPDIRKASVVISDLTEENFPVFKLEFPVRPNKFPVPLGREFCCKSVNLLLCQLSKSTIAMRIRGNSLLISLLAGNSVVETGST